MSTVYVSLGSNIEREYYVQQGLLSLEETFGELTLSSLFESEALGFSSDAFFNMVIGFETQLPVEQVALLLREIEFAHGRAQNAEKYSPRTLDLDMLVFDDEILTEPVQIPRNEITTSAFVLWPLAEIAGDKIHPVLKQSYQQLWQQFDQNSQQLRKVAFPW